MLFMSYWDEDMYLPEDTGNWVEATYLNFEEGGATHTFYRFKFLVGLVHQEST